MALNSLGLGFLFTARDLASAKIRALDRSMRNLDSTTDATAAGFDKGLKKMAVGLGVFTAGAVGLRGSLKLAGAAGDFEQEMARVRAITQATDEDFALLSKAAKQAGIDTQFDPGEAAKGLANLGQNGFTAKESIDALVPSLDLAAGGSIEVAQATATVNAALKGFGLDAADAGDAADKLLKISNLTSLSAGDLELALGTVSKGAGTTKQSLDEMLVSIGLVRNSGVSAAVASSQVSIALLKMSKNAKKFKKIGVEVTNADGSFRNFVDIARDTDVALQGVTNEAERAAKLNELFGRGLGAVNAINAQISKGVRDTNGNILTGAAAVDFLRSQMKSAQGTAGTFRDIMQDTFKGQLTLLKGSMSTLAIELGQPIAEVLKPVVAGLIVVINALIKGFSALPAPVKKVIGVLALLVPLITAATGAYVALRGAMMILGPAMAAMRTAFMAAMGPLLPFLPIIAAVAAAFFALKYAFDNNIEGFGDDMREIWGELKGTFMELVDVIMKDVIPAFVEILKAAMPIIKIVVKAIAASLKLLLPVITFIAKFISKVLIVAIRGIVFMVKKVIEVFKTLGSVWRAISDGIIRAWRAIAEALSPIIDWLSEKIESFMEFLRSIKSGIDKIISAGKKVIGAAKKAGSFIAGAVVPGVGATRNLLESSEVQQVIQAQ